jgi:hypothetical protein
MVRQTLAPFLIVLAIPPGLAQSQDKRGSGKALPGLTPEQLEKSAEAADRLKQQQREQALERMERSWGKLIGIGIVCLIVLGGVVVGTIRAVVQWRAKPPPTLSKKDEEAAQRWLGQLEDDHNNPGSDDKHDKTGT